MPLAVRVLCYLLVADFGHYWIHRLMHYKVFWRIHKWHHAPDYMYWLMGVRTTVPQQVLVNLPATSSPTRSSTFRRGGWRWPSVPGHAVQNDWMHVNVTWRSSWLEWLIVTPRYHHIHHSDQPEHYVANLAALFVPCGIAFSAPTCDHATALRRELSFGIDEKVHDPVVPGGLTPSWLQSSRRTPHARSPPAAQHRWAMLDVLELPQLAEAQIRFAVRKANVSPVRQILLDYMQHARAERPLLAPSSLEGKVS